MFIYFITKKLQKSTSKINLTFSMLETCQLSKLTEAEKLKFKQSRPTPDLSIEQEFISKDFFY